MSDVSKIEWTDATWNPVRGCIKISPGCKHCYAETFAERWRGVPGHPYEQGFAPRLVPEKLSEPLLWARPRRIFVNSMSDLFGEFVPFDYLAATLGVMGLACHHIYQVLTKRAARARLLLERLTLDRCMEAVSIFDVAVTRRQTAQIRAGLADGSPFAAGSDAPLWPLPNVWLGVSVEDRRFGLPRVEELRRAPAALRFLSVEPLLEALGEIDLTGIHWVIIGGESGRGARPCNLAWIRSVVAQADAASVPVFVKQLGAAPVGGPMVLLRSKKGGDPSEWPADLAERRAFPRAAGGA